jgi:hypothetical protein
LLAHTRERAEGIKPLNTNKQKYDVAILPVLALETGQRKAFFDMIFLHG